MSVTLAVRRGWPEGLLNKIAALAIKLAQPHEVWHTALILDGYMYGSNVARGVHKTPHIELDHTWELIELPWADEHKAKEVFDRLEGAKYDWFGLVDWALRRSMLTLFGVQPNSRLENPRYCFCSELNAAMLGQEVPVQYSPSALARLCELKNNNFIVNVD